MPEPATLSLFTTAPIWGLPSNSPACAKLETWLRMTELPYESPPLDFARAPKGKIPFIADGERLIGDSTLIIDHLGATRGVDLDRELDPRERAISLAFRRMLKENDYWGIIHCRYVIPTNWARYREILAPALGGLEAAEGFRDGVIAAMHAHGIGRHSGAELMLLIRQDLQAVADLLGDRTWMLGRERPTTLDATVFGYVANLIEHPYDDPLTEFARSLTNVRALCRRIRDRYFPELVEG